jgi:L-amino acid N-acyltransferase YncA
MEPEDWPAVERVYAEGIASRLATFETSAPDHATFDASRLPWGRLVVVTGEGVVGWIAGMPTSPRQCYAGVVEHSVYVGASSRGRGFGRMLLQAFLVEARRAGAWTVQGTMFPENTASVSLHERLGFRFVGRRERIAQLDGVWRDTVLYERRLPAA